MQARFSRGGTLSAEVSGGRQPGNTPYRMEIVGDRGTLLLSGGAARGFQASVLGLTLNGQPVALPEDALAALPDSVVNVAHIYAALRDDINTGSSAAPSFADAAELARLIDQIGGTTTARATA